MKKICILFLISFQSFAQNNEFQVHYKYGIPTNNLHAIQPVVNGVSTLQIMKVRPIYDQGLTALYKYKIWKKYKIFLIGGIEIASSRDYQPIYANYRHLDNIEIITNRFGLHYGLHKQFEFYDAKLILELGVQFVDRYYFQNEVDYTNGDFQSNNEDWIEYKYDLKTHHGEMYDNNKTVELKPYLYLNSEYNATLKFKVTKNMFFNVGFSYSRNNIYFYDYTFSVLYYYNGSTTPNGYFNENGIIGDEKHAVRTHYFYLNSGLSYKFDWKKKSKDEDKL